jgi:hypothetical protein
MSKYVEITGADMAELLKGSKGWTLTKNGHTKELVYEYIIPSRPELVVKVYTSIKDNVSRRKGQDAIRVCCVNTKLDKGWIKSASVYRVEGWRNNLKKRIISVIKDAKNRK